MAKTWFITGTSSGFGRTLTEKLLERGARVAATLRNVSALDALPAHFGNRLWIAALDVTDTQAVREVVDRAFRELGRIDVIVNNARYGLVGAAEEVSDEQIHQVIDTNVIGSIDVVRAALPHLRTQGGGRILQVASEGGQTVYPNFSPQRNGRSGRLQPNTTNALNEPLRSAGCWLRRALLVRRSWLPSAQPLRRPSPFRRRRRRMRATSISAPSCATRIAGSNRSMPRLPKHGSPAKTR